MCVCVFMYIYIHEKTYTGMTEWRWGNLIHCQQYSGIQYNIVEVKHFIKRYKWYPSSLHVSFHVRAFNESTLYPPNLIPTTRAQRVNQSSVSASLKQQDDGTPSSKWIGLCNFSFFLEFTAMQRITVLVYKCVSTSSSLSASFWYDHHYGFCVWGYSSNEISIT